MKRILILVIVFCSFIMGSLNAQTIQLRFTADNMGYFVELDSVMIENITQSGSTTLYYPDTVLTLITTGIIGNNSIDEDFYILQNYPNPFESKTKIDINVPNYDVFTLNVYDISGKLIVKKEIELSSGLHSFEFIGGTGNSYILEVNSKNFTQKILMIKVGTNGNDNPSLSYLGITNSNQKSAKAEFLYNFGDELRYTGFLNLTSLVITDAPSTDSDYIFNFNCVEPEAPIAGIQVAGQNQIQWNWNAVDGATGYKYNVIDDYETATDNQLNVSFVQSELYCETQYSIYVWAYNDCGESEALHLLDETSLCPFDCGQIYTDNRDGNTYNTVQIGDQCWMAENLKYLPVVHNYSEFRIARGKMQPAYSVNGYNGNSIVEAKEQINYNAYGVLYNWWAVMAGAEQSNTTPSGVQGVCPLGWQVPSDYEWQKLLDYTVSQGYSNEGSNENGAGNALKSCRQVSSPIPACNTSTHPRWDNSTLNGFNQFGFNAMPGGQYQAGHSDLYVQAPGIEAIFASTTITNNEFISTFQLSSSIVRLDNYLYPNSGVSVRCVRYNSTPDPTPPTIYISSSPAGAGYAGVVNESPIAYCVEGEFVDHIWANPGGSSMLSYYFPEFLFWTGDVAYVTDPNSSPTSVTMPDSNIRLTAKFASLDLCDGEGYFIDERDGNIYTNVQIGNKCWMAENLKYLPEVNDNETFVINGNSFQPGYGVLGYNGDIVESAKANQYYSIYGAYYNWYAAIAGSESSTSNPSGVQGICPAGWHLPSDDEWKELEVELGMSQLEADNTSFRGTNVGSKLVGSAEFWEKSYYNNYFLLSNIELNSISGFWALPGGYRRPSDGTAYTHDFGCTYFWTATQGSNSEIAWQRGLSVQNSGVDRQEYDKREGDYIRCVKD